MTIQKLFYKRKIHIDNLLSCLISYKKGVRLNIHRMLYPISIKNNNTITQTIRTIVLLIPIIPGGIIGLHSYIKNITTQYNKYYNESTFKTHIEQIYGYEI